MTATKKRPAPWSAEENRAIVALYFRMLDGSLRTDGLLNKAALVRIAQGQPKGNDLHATSIDGFRSQLQLRSRPSIEMKLMNCSAIHGELTPDSVTMNSHGYRAMPNYQTALKQAMTEHLEQYTLDIHSEASA